MKTLRVMCIFGSLSAGTLEVKTVDSAEAAKLRDLQSVYVAAEKAKDIAWKNLQAQEDATRTHAGVKDAVAATCWGGGYGHGINYAVPCWRWEFTDDYKYLVKH
jgi:hypothetical protein